MAYFQQGDVLIKPVSELPQWRQADINQNMKKVEVPELILAEGETTGHAHRVKGKITKFVPKDSRAGRSDTIIFELTEDAVLSHEEHKTFTLPAGTYYIEQVKEFDHFTGSSRAVRD
jgi:hypothetical protein